MLFLDRKFHLIPAHNIESYCKQQLQKIIITEEIVDMCY